MSERIFISEKCIGEVLEQEIIILNVDTGMYHQLNRGGIIIWNEIKKDNPSETELLERLKKQFPGEVIEDEIRKFLKDLLEREIIYLE